MKKPIYFILLLIVVKIAYLYYESNYNFDILHIATDIDATNDEFREIEKRGHKLSSIGLSLLLLPYFYAIFAFIFSKFQKRNLAALMLSICAFFGSYNYIYHKLELLMDCIVAQNSDKRYESYYINLLKYGMIAKIFGYEKYIPREHEFSVPVEKTMLSNIFLLTFGDKDIVERVRTGEKSRNLLASYYSKNKGKEEYEKEFTKFKDSADKISNGWMDYQKNQAKFPDNNYTTNPDKAYDDMMNKIADEYAEFKEKANHHKQYVRNKMLRESLGNAGLSLYFKNRNDSIAKGRYDKLMFRIFGTYIEPERWCEAGICPSKNASRKVVDEESNRIWLTNSKGIPINATQDEFTNHKSTIENVIDELHKNDINVSQNFAYDKEEFSAAYINMIKAKFGNIDNNQTTQTDIPAGITKYSDFVALFESDFANTLGDDFGKVATDIVASGDLTRFRDEIFGKKFTQQFSYTKTQFDSNSSVMDIGDDAIRLLYIPPFAIALSLIAGVLNLISVAFLFFEAIKGTILPAKNTANLRANLKLVFIKNGAKFIVICAVCIAIFAASGAHKLRENAALSAIDTHAHPIVARYIGTLPAIIWLESINYEFVKNLRAK